MRPANSYVPTISSTMRISMAGDDCSLHFDLDNLTDKQREDHVSNQVLTAMLQVALLYIGKPGDEVCLYDTFTNAPWQTALTRYQRMFQSMGLAADGFADVSHHPVDGFYESVAGQPAKAENENLYLVSQSNWPLHQSAEQLTTSRNLNSKVHFAAHAPGFGIPVPATLHVTKADIQSAEVTAFFAEHGAPLVLKTLGLAGARNVTLVADVEEAAAYLAAYEPDLDVILQQRLSMDDYTEMTVDLCVSDDKIRVTNVRQILFADGLWVGNLMGSGVALADEHRNQLLRLGEYARTHGYSAPEGVNLGIDYFIRNETAPADLPDLLVTEINARWTGGLFPAELVRRLELDSENVVAFIDMCPPARFDDYLTFLETHLYSTDAAARWSIAPMGFAPFPMEVEGTEILFVWQIVIGDFEAFKAARELELGSDVLITAPRISVSL